MPGPGRAAAGKGSALGQNGAAPAKTIAAQGRTSAVLAVAEEAAIHESCAHLGEGRWIRVQREASSARSRRLGCRPGGGGGPPLV